MLRATDGHAKNFSLRLLAGGAYYLTPFYDVLSAWPIIGNGPNRFSPRTVRMAMAVRGKNAHYRFAEIKRRHWNDTARRFLGEGAVETIITALIEQTPQVIESVAAIVPAGFPQDVLDSILNGLAHASRELANMPAGQ